MDVTCRICRHVLNSVKVRHRLGNTLRVSECVKGHTVMLYARFNNDYASIPLACVCSVTISNYLLCRFLHQLHAYGRPGVIMRMVADCSKCSIISVGMRDNPNKYSGTGVCMVS